MLTASGLHTRVSNLERMSADIVGLPATARHEKVGLEAQMRTVPEVCTVHNDLAGYMDTPPHKRTSS